MKLLEILNNKGSTVYTITPDESLEDVVQTLVRNRCGSLVVCVPAGALEGHLVGIITERDILRATAAHLGPLENVKVADVMTRDVITCSPNDGVEDVMGLMTTNRIRHLPVVEEGRLVGLVSIGDVVKAQHDQLTLENHYLKSYILG
jgi:CBS domain-containing protein